MGIFKSFIITFLSLLVLTWVFPSVNYVNMPTLFAASVVLTILQKIIQPVLKVLFLPINIITLGIFSWLIDGLVVWLAVLLVPGFHIDPFTLFNFQLNSFFSIVFAAFAIGIIQSIIQLIL